MVERFKIIRKLILNNFKIKINETGTATVFLAYIKWEKQTL